jgi:hypothetical protein
MSRRRMTCEEFRATGRNVDDLDAAGITADIL